uniref:Uncharacterized protein n=1 Tax=Eubacterium plexicaudatum ASF492 TaxID=1235802 RepID=N2B4H3_9FIRM
MVQKVTGGNFEHERAEPFLEEALNIYDQKQE